MLSDDQKSKLAAMRGELSLLREALLFDKHTEVHFQSEAIKLKTPKFDERMNFANDARAQAYEVRQTLVADFGYPTRFSTETSVVQLDNLATDTVDGITALIEEWTTHEGEG